MTAAVQSCSDLRRVAILHEKDLPPVSLVSVQVALFVPRVCTCKHNDQVVNTEGSRLMLQRLARSHGGIPSAPWLQIPCTLPAALLVPHIHRPGMQLVMPRRASSTTPLQPADGWALAAATAAGQIWTQNNKCTGHSIPPQHPSIYNSNACHDRNDKFDGEISNAPMQDRLDTSTRQAVSPVRHRAGISTSVLTAIC